MFSSETVFFDVAGIAPGDDWQQRLDVALDRCDTMLVVVGPRWLEGVPGQRRIDAPSDMVAWEVARALSRGLRVIQVLVQGAQPLTAEVLPAAIAGLAMRQAVAVRHESFATDARELGGQIKRSRRGRTGFAGDWLNSELSEWVPRVIDSGAEGTVAAITVINALELLLMRAGVREKLSVRYLYEKAQLSGRREPTLPEQMAREEGIHLLAALFVASMFGVPRDRIWPYKPESRNLPSSEEWRVLERRLGWCCRGDFFRTDGLADAVRQLAAGRPVIMGIDFFVESWEAKIVTRTGQVMMPPTDAMSAGLTTILLVGYDVDRRRFRFLNTWGQDWGDHGFGTLELDVARRIVHPGHLWSVELSADTVAEIRAAQLGTGPLKGSFRPPPRVPKAKRSSERTRGR
jgi:hypothetical protein